MELKPILQIHLFKLLKLLIVPYGIETKFQNLYRKQNMTFNRTLWN